MIGYSTSGRAVAVGEGVTHGKETHTPDACGEVYTRPATDRNFPILVQFDWKNV